MPSAILWINFTPIYVDQLNAQRADQNQMQINTVMGNAEVLFAYPADFSLV